MSLFRDDGVVLRAQKLGEADRIMLCLCGGRPPHPQQAWGGVR
ncbi:recombination protein O [Streptomyces sp. BK239]|nr:recombination protein O [Streptomyces sp. BK239]